MTCALSVAPATAHAQAADRVFGVPPSLAPEVAIHTYAEPVSQDIATRAAQRFLGRAIDSTQVDFGMWLLPAKRRAAPVWRVAASPRFPGDPQRPVAIVDAVSGAVVEAYDVARHAGRSFVYPENPVRTPLVSEVQLPVASGASFPINALFQTLNCVDKRDVRPTLLGPTHFCHLESTARADTAGDFVFDTPGDTEPEDPFAETNAFHHANVFADFMQTLGAPDAKQRVQIVTNLMWPSGFAASDPARMADPDAPLDPYIGAFFAPTNPLFTPTGQIDVGVMWFGQGPVRDYAYDADIDYHEYIHELLFQHSQLLGVFEPDRFGLTPGSRALEEALADYFSSAFTGDPEMGEYAAPNLRPGQPHYRQLDNDQHCRELSGEEHHDSHPLAGALWRARASLIAADQQRLDQVVLSVILGAHLPRLRLADFAELLRQELQRRDLSAIWTALHAQLETRGLLGDCYRNIAYTGEPLGSSDDLRNDRLWIAPGGRDTAWGMSVQAAPFPFTPALVQFSAEVPPHGRHLTVSARVFGPPAEVSALVRFDGDIEYDWSAVPPAVARDVIVPLTGTWPRQTATIDVPTGVQRVSVQIVQHGAVRLAYRDVELRVTAGAPHPTVAETAPLEPHGGCRFRPARPATVSTTALALLAAGSR